jgi:hypothetical protein
MMESGKNGEISGEWSLGRRIILNAMQSQV